MGISLEYPLSIKEIASLIIIGFAFVSFAIQLVFYFKTNLKLNYIFSNHNRVFSNNKPFVSVIIAAKNEAINLQKFLPLVLTQNYPDYEVIVVDDGSFDDTQKVLSELTEAYKHLRIIKLENSQGKKLALTAGIKSASSEFLLFIDADCYPASENWIDVMVNSFSDNRQIVLGYGAYRDERTMLSDFIRFDTYLIGLHYFYASIIGKPYMGVGRNIAYKKDLWEKGNGFSKHLEIASGDDDLFVSDVANANNTQVCLDEKSFTISVPAETLSQFIRQKARHISTSGFYSMFFKFFTSIELISRAVLFISIVFLLFFGSWHLAIILFTFRLLFVYFIGKYSRKIFNNKIRFYYFILFDIFAPIFYLAVLVSNKLIYSNKEW
ncbi:MAG: glycosyltransferase [Bacteroidales bacterium]|nr:glycosyltransferase [Bacteroidales bacterium]